MNKKVSIIMGVYNCEKTLLSTIKSIIAQTYTNWELIICDDGSSDNTLNIAKSFCEVDSRIIAIENSINRGLAYTLNHCLEHITGEFVMRHDGDDLMVVDRIYKQVKFMNKTNCDVCGSGAYMIDGNGIWGLRQPKDYPNKNCMVMGAPFIHPTVIFKRNVLEEVNGYSVNDATLQRLEDYELWIKIFERKYILRNIQEPLIYFREDKESYSRKKRSFRIMETKARFLACRKLEIKGIRRFLALKPIVLMLIPTRILRKHHIKNAKYCNEVSI